MIRRLATAAILIPLVLVAIFYFPLWGFLLFVGVFVFLGIFELLRLLAHYGVRSYRLTFGLALLLPWTWAYAPTTVPAYLMIAALLCMGWSVTHTQELKTGFQSAAGNLLAILYVGAPLAIGASFQARRSLELLMILLVIWASDIAALLVGRQWGRHKVTPRLSPNKSLEGYIAGLVFSMLTALFFGWSFLPTWPPVQLAAIGAFLAGVGMVGDLFESMLKRGAQLKDSSNLMPGHGGVLDRIDGLLFALPAYYALFVLIK